MPESDESAPAGHPAEEHLDGEAPVEAGSELDECAAEAILALTKASRASLLYDADNEAVAGFLSELNDRFGQALRHGELVLGVQPFEIVRDGRVVYRNPDREKSLAARLYNDGVRKLIFSTGLTWDELVRLVEILTIRFSGIRQQEDDIVTLIW